ncbi:MAG TPA: hypothetical protein VL984_11160 [Acidimicrobiales bacterium]|nr:hypothetical protein [Acidimicrobiales bacterium]
MTVAVDANRLVGIVDASDEVGSLLDEAANDKKHSADVVVTQDF